MAGARDQLSSLIAVLSALVDVCVEGLSCVMVVSELGVVVGWDRVTLLGSVASVTDNFMVIDGGMASSSSCRPAAAAVLDTARNTLLMLCLSSLTAPSAASVTGENNVSRVSITFTKCSS